MKALTAALFVATSTLTTIGTIVFVLVAVVGVAAFVMAIRLKRAVNDLEAAVERQAVKIAEITGHIVGG